jgi:hypothetical protein
MHAAGTTGGGREGSGIFVASAAAATANNRVTLLRQYRRRTEVADGDNMAALRGQTRGCSPRQLVSGRLPGRLTRLQRCVPGGTEGETM